MKISIMTMTCALLLALTAAAQKKELNQAQLKSGKDLDKAERLMTGLLASLFIL